LPLDIYEESCIVLQLNDFISNIKVSFHIIKYLHKGSMLHSLLVAAVIINNAAATIPNNNLRTTTIIKDITTIDGIGISSEYPALDNTRRHIQEDTSTTLFVSEQCLNNLVAAACDDGQIGPEDYFVFTDGMSNGYYTQNNLSDYSDLTMQNKFAFVTLSCQCKAFGVGGASNCCQGDRANINVQGINIDDPNSMSTQLQDYIADICSTTTDAIGEENILPPTGEEPVQLPPTVSPSDRPTSSVSPTGTSISTPTIDSSSPVADPSPNVPTRRPTDTSESPNVKPPTIDSSSKSPSVGVNMTKSPNGSSSISPSSGMTTTSTLSPTNKSTSKSMRPSIERQFEAPQATSIVDKSETEKDVSESNELSAGAIAGIIIAVVVLPLLIVYITCKKTRNEAEVRDSEQLIANGERSSDDEEPQLSSNTTNASASGVRTFTC